jgi:hypothetical protein
MINVMTTIQFISKLLHFFILHPLFLSSNFATFTKHITLVMNVDHPHLFVLLYRCLPVMFGQGDDDALRGADPGLGVFCLLRWFGLIDYLFVDLKGL